MKKNGEIVRYTVWGILSAVLNVGLFRLLKVVIDYRIANVITLIVVKLFSYVTNKVFVFQTTCANLKQLLKEISSFLSARLFTFLIDFFGVILLVEVMDCDEFISKCIMAVVVVVLNYMLSKRFVFRKK